MPRRVFTNDGSPGTSIFLRKAQIAESTALLISSAVPS